MNEIEIITTDCPRVLCDPPPGGSLTTIDTMSGDAVCGACGEQWTYGQHELVAILENLED